MADLSIVPDSLIYPQISKGVPFIYPEIVEGVQNQFTNVLLIDRQVPDYQLFVDSVNSSTFPIVYSTMSSKTELLSLLQKMFTSISRIGIAFTSELGYVKIFLDCNPLFKEEEEETVPFSENVQFIIDVIKEFSVTNIDYLACNTLNYTNWTNYYQLLTLNTGVVVGASSDETGNIKYGGDWTMESTGQDIELIYFTQSIEYYTYLLDNPPAWVSGSQFSGWLSPWGIAIYDSYMYVSCSGAWGSHNGTIQKISLATNPPAAPTIWISSLRNNCAIVIYGGFMYIAIAFSGTVTKVNLTTAGQTTWMSGLNVPVGLAIDSGYIYVSCQGNGSIIKMDVDTRITTTTWATGLSSPNGLVIYAGYLYVANGGTGSIIQIDLMTANKTTLVSGLSNPTGLLIDFDYLYVSSRASGIISRINLTNTSTAERFYSSSNPLLEFTGLGINQNYLYAVAQPGVFKFGINYICFKSDSKILTAKGYIPIQDLRKGDMVKTLKHGYKAINIICKSVIYHCASKERIKDQLYKCSKDNFDEIFEPLIITGSHSILVDDFTSNEQREKTNKVLGDIFITDDKYRLPACGDERTSVYEIPGNYTVYHMALENDEYYENYGIFANGLLVETCSKRYLKELSNMTLIT